MARFHWSTHVKKENLISYYTHTHKSDESQTKKSTQGVYLKQKNTNVIEKNGMDV